jgi:hypothetical protein
MASCEKGSHVREMDGLKIGTFVSHVEWTPELAKIFRQLQVIKSRLR